MIELNSYKKKQQNKRLVKKRVCVGSHDWVGLNPMFPMQVARKMVEEESPLHWIATSKIFNAGLHHWCIEFIGHQDCPFFSPPPHNCCQASVPSIKSAVKIALNSPALPIFEFFVIWNHSLGSSLYRRICIKLRRTEADIVYIGMNIIFSWNLSKRNITAVFRQESLFIWSL